MDAICATGYEEIKFTDSFNTDSPSSVPVGFSSLFLSGDRLDQEFFCPMYARPEIKFGAFDVCVDANVLI